MPSDTQSDAGMPVTGTETAIAGVDPNAAAAAGSPNAPTDGQAADHLAAASSHNAVAAWFEHQWTALRHGAASVYHEAVALESDVTKWTVDNPQIGALVDEGLALADDYLTRYAGALGLPLPAISLVGHDMVAALKAIAAADATVPSGGPVPEKVVAEQGHE